MLASLPETLRTLAQSLGFARMGVARAEAFGVEADRLRAWLSDGRHGDMKWMAQTAEVRADVTHEGMLPSARSVIVLATPYARDAGRVGPAPGRVARYARGRDYHNVLHKRAKKLAALLRENGHAARISVDSMPVYERAWAERAGLGFIGKNACLIIPGLGSHVLLTAIVTSAELPASERMGERCGTCTLCLDACPTRAFKAARELDARRCISYLTIETRDSIPEELRPEMGDWIFGCDACQDVCPYNKTALPPEGATAPFAASERWQRVDAEGLLQMDAEAFAAFAHASPIQRPGRVGMARNAALVLGNSRDKRHLPVLRDVAQRDSSEVVREAAAWAAARLERQT